MDGYPFVVKKSHKVVTCVNKKVCLKMGPHLRDFSKTAISLYLKDLIFACKLEMVLGSIFSGRKNPV